MFCKYRDQSGSLWAHAVSRRVRRIRYSSDLLSLDTGSDFDELGERTAYFEGFRQE